MISKDNENNDKLYLFVGFKDFNTISEYSYSFMLVNENDKPKTGYMTGRNEVAEHLPEEIKNKKQIIPIIKEMTRELLDSRLPQNIFRKTVEPVDGDSLKRYEEITNIMINEYGYKLIKTEKTPENITKWWLSQEKETETNKDMLKEYLIEHEYSTQELHKSMFDHILPLLKEMNLKPIFTGRFAKYERYDQIAKLLETELGYKPTWKGKDKQGKETWKFIKNNLEIIVNEDTIEEKYFSESISPKFKRVISNPKSHW